MIPITWNKSFIPEKANMEVADNLEVMLLEIKMHVMSCVIIGIGTGLLHVTEG